MLAIAPHGFNDHRKDARLVASNKQRDMPIDGDLSLQQLLSGGVYIRRVGECYILAELFLHGDAGGGVSQDAKIVRVHLDRARAE